MNVDTLTADRAARAASSNGVATREASAQIPLRAVGNTGLKGYTTGFVLEEFLPELRGLPGAKKYREMSDNDSVIGSTLYAIQMFMRQIPWTVEAASDSATAVAARDLVDECLFKDLDTPWSDVIEEITSMFVYGFAPVEKVYKLRAGVVQRPPMPAFDAGASAWEEYVALCQKLPASSKFTDNKIGVSRLALRAQDTIWRWIFDSHGDWQALEQFKEVAPSVIIPKSKLLLFRTSSIKNNPEGRSVLRNMFIAYERKRHLEIQEGRYATRKNGIALFRIPSEYLSPDADEQQRAIAASYKELAKTMSADTQGGLVIPSDRDDKGHLIIDFEFKALQTTQAASGSATDVIDRYDHRIAMAVLADFVMLGQKAVGSYAMSEDKSSMFIKALGGFCDGIEQEFNRELIRELCMLNGIAEEDHPRVRHGDIENKDLLKLATYLSTLASAGMAFFPDDNLENYLREQGGLPEKPEDLDERIADEKEEELRRQQELMRTRAGNDDDAPDDEDA